MVDGALRALGTDPDLVLLLVGPPEVADGLVGGLSGSQRTRVGVRPVPDRVAMADPASRGADRRTSIGAAMHAVGAGHADAVVSAGPSGVSVAAAVIAIGRMSGVRRPALAAVLPSSAGPVVLLDVGAGMQVNPADLVHHAMLGAEYARLAAAVLSPRVGLLSVGSEPGKGDRLRRAADAALRLHHLPSGARYVGPVEGNDVVQGGRAEVIVTDGFTGNVLLKTIEALLRSPGSAAQMPRAAALLGVASTAVICHGAATGDDVASGIALAARLVRSRVVDRLGDGGAETGDATGAGAAGGTCGAAGAPAAEWR